MGSQALADAQNRIMTRLDQIEKQKIAEVEKLYGEKMKAIENAVFGYKSQIDSQKSLVENKLQELTQEIEKRKKGQEDKLQEKAKDLFEGILKK